VIRSDSGDAHRLSLSARVLSTVASQVKAKPKAAEALLTSMKTTSERSILPLQAPVAMGRARLWWRRERPAWLWRVGGANFQV